MLATVAGACASDADTDDDGGAPTPTSTSAPTEATEPGSPTDADLPDDLRLHELQVIGTHNSFHLPLEADEFALLEELDAAQAAQRTYAHVPLGEQLAEQRVRQLELDLFVDTQGGRYADPALARRAGGTPLGPEMGEPGIKVLHEQDVDFRSVCPTLVACLTEVEAWSDANPDHVPVAIHLQLKDGPLVFDVADQAVPEPWDAEQLDALDAEIASVFEPDDLITPDDVRGERATLEEAVLAGEWPTLGESRGKVLFLMINAEPYRGRYLDGHAGLAGRLLFVNAAPGQPHSAYFGVDDPLAEGDRIRELVELGYLVRTRSDTPGVEADANDATRLEAALASGAHWISTDYPGPDGAGPQLGTDYVAQLPGFAPARCNPLTAPAACDD